MTSQTELPTSAMSNPLRSRLFQILEVARPGDGASRMFDLLLILLILSNVLAILLESVPAINRVYGDWFSVFDTFSIVIFTIEYAARIWVSVENPAYLHEGVSAWRARLSYLRSPAALVDLIAILPSYIGLLGSSDTDLRILRAFRLLRIFKLTRYSQSMALMLNAISGHIRSFVAAIFILLIVMLLAASGMYVFEKEAQPEAFGSIPHAMWWAFATLTTVGYGDVTPITTMGKVFGAAITVVGVGMVALPAGILASAFSEQLRLREKMYEDVLDTVYEDGVVDAQEEELLRETRESLEINETTALRIESSKQRVASGSQASAAQKCCPHCGGAL